MTDDDRVRVYTPGARTAHLLPWSASPNSYSAALCGREPRWEDGFWHGTGGQGEYDHAEQLPLCKRCKEAVR